MLWSCPSCKTANAIGAKRCVICMRPYNESAKKFEAPSIRMKVKTDPQIMAEREKEAEKSKAAMVALEERLIQASMELEKKKDSIPPRAAVRIVIPNDWMGWATVVAIVLLLASAIAIIKTLF